MNSLRYFVAWLLTLSLSNASAFNPLFSRASRPTTPHTHFSNIKPAVSIRGGEQQQPAPVTNGAAAALPGIAAMGNLLATAGRIYTQQLDKFPIVTKSYTAGLIFGLSDYIAQTIEKTDEKSKLDKTRLVATTLVGLLYFGPAAHYWYEIIFRLLPGSSLWSTLQKAFWGQIIFGPSFTCIFFATSLLQSGQFSLGAWGQKIKTDLPGAWLAGVGFWPLVDLISYSMIPVKWIPLFINMCSLVWTVYLSIVSNRSSRKQSTK